MNGIAALAINGFRESRRNRVTVVVFLFAFLLIFSATFALEMTVATFERVMTDLGLGVMSLITVLLTIFLGSGLIPREIERRTIFMIVSKPVARSAFVIGRLLGNLFTTYFVMSIMVVLLIGQILLEGAPIRQPLIVAMIGIALEVMVLSAVSFAFAAGSSQFVTAVCCSGLYFLGHLATDLYKFSDRAKVPALRFFGKVAYYVLPNLDRLDWKGRATYADVTDWSEVGSSALYAVGYSVIMVLIATAVFEKRDFK